MMSMETFFIATLRAHFGSSDGSQQNAFTCPMTEFWMGDVIKLRAARKQAKRLRDEKRAAANRLLHGRSKAERDLDAARDTKARQDLDQHRVDTGDEG
jgi:hypothetical protein